jgi:hypothetical protein
MTVQEIKDKIVDLAAKHKQEEDDESAFSYEIDAEDLILAYLVANNISLGSYDLKGLLEYEDVYELEDRRDILGDLQMDLSSDSAPFEVHPDAKDLFNFYEKTFWPDYEN